MRKPVSPFVRFSTQTPVRTGWKPVPRLRSPNLDTPPHPPRCGSSCCGVRRNADVSNPFSLAMCSIADNQTLYPSEDIRLNPCMKHTTAMSPMQNVTNKMTRA